ncbi:MAG TPA: pre-peptidase C-terminal domain-containing protein, partial [Gemmataceae bacterium]|nr:pre-peptidase C-terminal domain-containing protein [Gemmataceae bacterium]
WVNIGALQAGDIITITVSGAASGAGTLSDPFAERWRAGSGTAVRTDDDAGPGTDSIIYRFTITTTDTYFVMARPFDAGTGTGTYRVGIRLENTGTAPTTGGAFAAETEANDTLLTANDGSGSWRQVQNQSVTTGSITAGDVDVIRYTLTAGDRVTIRAVGAAGLQPSVELLNAGGSLLQSVDNSTAAESTLYGFIVPTTGTYFVRVQSAAGAGTYALTAFQSGTAPPATVNSFDVYAVPLAAGQTVSAGLWRATAGSPFVQILDPTGLNVIANGDPVTNYTRAAYGIASTAGTYYVIVVDTVQSAYQLTITLGAALDRESNNTPGTASPLTGSTMALGGLTAGDSDWYTFVVDAGNPRVRVSTATPGDAAGEFVNTLDPVVEIYNPGGTLIASDNNSGGDGRNAVATANSLPAGTYRVRVLTAGGTTGEYALTAEILPNQVPTGASAGGPYTVAEGGSLVLAGTATDPDGDPLAYEWDVNNDGVFTDATGAAPTLTWAQLVALGISDGPFTGTVAVRATDTFSPPVVSSGVALSVTNAAPTATLGNSGPTTEGSATPSTVSATGATDPSPADAAAGFRYAYDFDNDGTFDLGGVTYATAVPDTTATVPAALLADGGSNRVVRVRVFDKDGGESDSITTIQVNNANPTAGLTHGGTVNEGTNAAVTASGTDVPADQPTLRYAYDFGNNGTFEVGGSTYATAVPTTTATVPTTDSGPLMVRVRVFDKDGGVADATTTVTVTNVAPTGLMSNGGAVVEGSAGLVSFAALFDPSSADTTAGFTYAFDFDDDGTFDVTGATGPTAVPANFLPDGPATRVVRGRVFDKDGDFTEATTTITITNAAPTGTFTNGGPVAEGNSGTADFSVATDPSAADLAALRYAFDFNNDGAFEVGGLTYAT